MHHHNAGTGCELCDAREIAPAVRELRIERRVDRETRRDQDCGYSRPDPPWPQLERDDAVRAATVVHDDRCPTLPEPGGEEADLKVRRPAGRERHNHADGLARAGLRPAPPAAMAISSAMQQRNRSLVTGHRSRFCDLVIGHLLQRPHHRRVVPLRAAGRDAGIEELLRRSRIGKRDAHRARAG